MTKHPYQTITLNHLETLSLFTSMLTIFCGIFYIINIETTDADSGTSDLPSASKLKLINFIVYLNENTKIFLFAIILIANLTFFIYWLFKMLQELRSMFIKKFSFLYIYFCLCGNHQKYNLVHQTLLIDEENEHLREKFMNVLREIKNAYKQGHLILNNRNLEKISLYLEVDKVL